MKVKVQAFKKKDMPSKWGGTWTIVNTKFEGMANPEFGYQLSGFGKDKVKNLEIGQTLVGYMGQRPWTDKNGNPQITKTFNAISPEYLYDLILKIDPHVEQNVSAAKPEPDPDVETGPDMEITSPGW